MGAAASVQQVYLSSIKWFHNYVDEEVYISDYEELDKEHDGGVSFGALQNFIEEKTKKEPDSPWAIFKSNGPVLMIAHKAASEVGDVQSSVTACRMVGITEFRNLLIQLLAISILWRYFLTAEHQAIEDDAWVNKPMTLEEFSVACRALCENNSHENLTDAQIKEDFDMLAVNYSDTVGFISVCNYCTKFIDPACNPLVAQDNEKKGIVNVVVPKFFGEEGTVVQNYAPGTKKIFSGMDVEEKKKLAMVQLANQVDSAEKSALRAMDSNDSKVAEEESAPTVSTSEVVISSDIMAAVADMDVAAEVKVAVVAEAEAEVKSIPCDVSTEPTATPTPAIEADVPVVQAEVVEQ